MPLLPIRMPLGPPFCQAFRNKIQPSLPTLLADFQSAYPQTGCWMRSLAGAIALASFLRPAGVPCLGWRDWPVTIRQFVRMCRHKLHQIRRYQLGALRWVGGLHHHKIRRRRPMLEDTAHWSASFLNSGQGKRCRRQLNRTQKGSLGSRLGDVRAGPERPEMLGAEYPA